MKKLLFIPLSILFFVGCQKEENFETKTQDDLLSQASKAPNKKARPISGNLNNAPNPDAPPIICSGAFPISGQNFIYGNVSHLGLLKSGTVGNALICDITNFPSALDPSLRGTITFNEIWVAANGDKLFSNSTIYIVGDPATQNATLTWTGSNIITGGTGRFEGATGSWEQLNGKFFADGTATWSIKGEITY